LQIGYIRVSTEDQNTIRQEELMKAMGVEEVYIDRISGKNTERPNLKKMMGYIRKGDTVVVESISRFARNTRDLLDLVKQLDDKQVKFVSQKENIDTGTPTGKFMLTIFGAGAELEREYILQRQAEGIAIAKQLGKYKGRKKIVASEGFDKICAEWKAGHITATKAMELLGMKRNTFYRRVAEFRNNLAAKPECS